MTSTKLLIAIFVAGAIFAATMMLARAQDKGAASQPTGGGSKMPKYSKSGYDITPMSREAVLSAAKSLTPEQQRIVLDADTERPNCGIFTTTMEKGIYVCVVGGLPLFRSDAKFISKSGWASFFEPFDPEHIIEREDRTYGMVRTEILDARSGAHLGHVFDDGPAPTGKRYCLNSAALKFIKEGDPVPEESKPATFETAYFAAGCFWGVEDRFQKIPGVRDAVSGYMGGTVDEPTYKLVCTDTTGHAETVKVVFDPKHVTYQQLLDKFFASHDPTTRNRQGPDFGTQYRSAVFATTKEQAEIAKKTIARLGEEAKYKTRPIVTQVIDPGPKFWPAEEYHQDYHKKHGGSCDY